MFHEIFNFVIIIVMRIKHEEIINQVIKILGMLTHKSVHPNFGILT